MAKKTYEIKIGHLRIQHNGCLVSKVYQSKYGERPYLCADFQDGEHIVGVLSELPRQDYIKIANYLKELNVKV